MHGNKNGSAPVPIARVVIPRQHCQNVGAYSPESRRRRIEKYVLFFLYMSHLNSITLECGVSGSLDVRTRTYRWLRGVIGRFWEKKKNRIWQRKVKYDVRKVRPTHQSCTLPAPSKGSPVLSKRAKEVC